MAEQINKLAIIDEALNFISPEIIAEAESSERVLPILKLSQLALSVFHPDRDIQDIDIHYQARGVHALTRINTLVKSFEGDQDLADLFYSTSNEIVDDSSDKIRTEIGLTNFTRLMREQITVKPESLDNTGIGLEATGEVVENSANQKLLAMLLGKGVISLLANSGSSSLSGIMPLLKKKFVKETDYPFGIDISEWTQVFDEIEANGRIDQTQVETNHVGDLVSDDILESLRDQRYKTFSTLLELLKPNDKLVYPEGWYRSFNGKIVCPTLLRDWPRYESFNVLNHDVELRVFDIHEVEDGVVTDSIRLDTSERESIELIKDMEDQKAKKWVKHLINYVAPTIGYEVNKFTKKSDNTGNNSPMDFIFEVTEDQRVNIIYTRPRDRDTENSNQESISFEDINFPKNSNALEFGYYMVKAGKNANTKKYTVNPPLALIKLVPEYQNQLVGTAFIGGQNNLYTGESVIESYSRRIKDAPNPNELPALLGSVVSFEKERLFNVLNLFMRIDSDRNYANRSGALLSEFVDDGNLLYHLTFIDDGDFLGSEEQKTGVRKAAGRVYSQTSLSGHRARLIKSK